MANYLANQDESLKEGVVQAQVVATTATPVVIPVPVEREVITNDMKAYSYSYTIKWVSGIDMFFALLYALYNWYWLFLYYVVMRDIMEQKILKYYNYIFIFYMKLEVLL